MTQSEVPTGRNKSLLVVAGSGRSGTSLFTGLAGRLGLYIPQPEIKPDATNPRGFGEPRWVLAFHKEMLKSVDVSHDDARPVAWELTAQVAQRARARRRLRAWLEEQFAVSDRVVVKDPRLAPFLGLYRTVADDLSVQLCVVTMLRHPAETVRSKETYYGDHLGSTARMASWLNMMLSVEQATRDLPSAVIRFDDLLTQWRPTLDAAEKPLSVELTSGASEEQIEAADELVDPTLRRVDPGWAELSLPPRLQDLAERAYHELDGLAISPGGGAGVLSAVVLDELRSAYAAYYGDSEALVRSSIRAARMAERRRVTRRLKAKGLPAQSGPRPEPGLRRRAVSLFRGGGR